MQSRERVDATLAEIGNEEEKRKALEAHLQFRQKKLEELDENKDLFKLRSIN